MADRIKLLPDHVANQIAAGEVVQRPASVVKELLENAIDAEASHIKLLIKDAGKTLVQVIDDGDGMSTTDARLSFERHATSKIKTAEDLFQLHTKGFRGEALASIAAVSHVELKTKTTSDEVGTLIRIEGSEVVEQEVTVTPKGTSVAVKNLFFNIPARRNFLKSNTVETRHIIDEFHRVSLAHPGVAFSMFNNGAEVFQLPISNLRQRIVAIFGPKTNEKLVPVKEDTPVVKMEGFVLKPEFAKKSRGDQFFFVNNRFIKNGYLHHAVLAAFEGLLKEGSQPGYFLFLEVDTKSIDINIHPTKTEVKFDDEHTLYAMLRSAVKHSLGQFSVTPVLDFERDKNLDTPYDYKNKPVGIPQIEVDKNFNPFKESEPGQKNITFPFKRDKTQNWESLYSGLQQQKNLQENTVNLDEIEFESEVVTGSLFSESAAESGQNTFQLHNKYLITNVKSGMLIIHQQRAHERVLYEELLKNITVQEAVSQQLLFPMELTFSKKDVALLHSVREQLEFTGFSFESFGDDTIKVKGIPTATTESGVQIIMDNLLDDLNNEVPDTGFSQNDLLARSMASSLAVKTGTPMGKEQQEHLVNSLFACKEPSVSPKNKEVFITIPLTDLDKKF
ncbi:DNA mismatch repair endonuclease MutL [Planktosalinus lacus]|uniref:DNA mismatch repair protein MutL n=1 Tax=Planktosalinus lacus TaxID=1526573 RepID=A0A8J2YA76_9FLAO|nr:DNA mismatch repair endonuclease MutL [Planktosalinus lacus]GGD92594.1 DNA mismatch repair protein MutL [Planktosalinus lacus]